ncbi:TPA: hypothetical protein ACMX4R_000265 [Yersinia enterocolitica]
MIKFTYKLCSHQIVEIKNSFIKSHMCAKKTEVLMSCAEESPEWYPALKKYLHYDNLIRIVFAKAEKLSSIKNEFNKDLSVINERYNPELFFKKLIIEEYYINLNISSKKNKDAMMGYKDSMIVELTRLEKIEKSYCANYFLGRLILANTADLVKKELKGIKGLQKGFSGEIKSHLKRIFPAWVSIFPEIFKYDLFSSKFGYNIVKLSGLSVCPFCNEEKITIVNGGNKRFRPALDHFYAKSKYPYLAVTLSNLIPIGGRCNTAFKSDIDMFDGYMNPLISGMNDIQVFDFNYNALNNSVALEIRETDDFVLNKILFELDGVYNSEEYKKKYIDFRYSYTFLKGLGITPPFYEDLELMDSTFNISKNKNYYTWPAKKFESDALDDIFKCL